VVRVGTLSARQGKERFHRCRQHRRQDVEDGCGIFDSLNLHRLAALRLVKVSDGNASSESRFVDRKTVSLDVVNDWRFLVHGWCLDRLELIEDSLWAGDSRGACCADARIESGIIRGSVHSFIWLTVQIDHYCGYVFCDSMKMEQSANFYTHVNLRGSMERCGQHQTLFQDTARLALSPRRCCE
jgi:hypothetical protein